MFTSGPTGTSRLQPWLFFVFVLLTAGAITCLALWGPAGSRRSVPPDADQSVPDWAHTAFAHLAAEACDDPETVVRTLFHPRMVEAIEQTANPGDVFASECDSDAEVRGVAPAPDFSEYADDPHFTFLSTADALWQVERGSEGEAGQAWLVVEEDGRRWLHSPYIHFYALCAAGAEEC